MQTTFKSDDFHAYFDTASRIATFGCRDRSCRSTDSERWVMSHLTEDDARKMITNLIEQIDADTQKITVDSVPTESVNFLQAGRTIWLGECYRHFSGPVYKVINFAKRTGTDETMVVYQACSGKQDTYVCTFDEFSAEVDPVKFPNVEQKYQFEQIS